MTSTAAPATKLYAYITPYSPLKGQDLHAVAHDKLLTDVSIIAHPDMGNDYIKVGEVEATVNLYPRQQVVAGAVASMRAEITAVQLQAGEKVARLEAAIGKLLAIEA